MVVTPRASDPPPPRLCCLPLRGECARREGAGECGALAIVGVASNQPAVIASLCVCRSGIKVLLGEVGSCRVRAALEQSFVHTHSDTHSDTRTHTAHTPHTPPVPSPMRLRHVTLAFRPRSAFTRDLPVSTYLDTPGVYLS